MSSLPETSSVSEAPRALVTARWVLLGALSLITLVQNGFPALLGEQIGGPWSAFGLVALGAALNVVAARRERYWSPRYGGIALLLDVAGLTAFLAISGAAANPFTMLYFVPIGLATLLPKGFTWLVATASSAGFALLLGITLTSSELGGHFMHHLLGMWLGLAISGVVITLFVHRLSAALAEQTAKLERARRAALEARHLATLGGIAAGAAHELGTPLGTIQLLAGELPAMSEAERAEAVRSIQRELLRCKEIVHGMATPELSASALESEQAWALASLQGEVEAFELPVPARGELDVSLRVHKTEAAELTTTQPRLVITRILRELLRNAVEACHQEPGPAAVDVTLDASDGQGRILVRDNGPGLEPHPADSAFDAFYSTKDTGRGLGLFLASAHLHQLGGSIRVCEVPAPGTCFEISFPLSAPRLSKRQVAA